MLKEKAGVIAGTIWNALNETYAVGILQLRSQTQGCKDCISDLYPSFVLF